MRVIHDNIKDYLDDLLRVKEKGGNPVVRTTLEETKINEGVSNIHVVSSFYDGEFLYEASAFCGELLKGDREELPLAEARKHIQEISEKCSELGFDHGGGRCLL